MTQQDDRAFVDDSLQNEDAEVRTKEPKYNNQNKEGISQMNIPLSQVLKYSQPEIKTSKKRKDILNNDANLDDVEDAPKAQPVPLKEINLPLAKIKKIMMLDEDTKKVSKDALMALTKATEMFIQNLAQQIEKMKPKKTTVLLSDIILSTAVHFGPDKFHFLRHDIPTPDKLEKANDKKVNQPLKVSQQSTQDTAADGNDPADDERLDGNEKEKPKANTLFKYSFTASQSQSPDT